MGNAVMTMVVRRMDVVLTPSVETNAEARALTFVDWMDLTRYCCRVSSFRPPYSCASNQEFQWNTPLNSVIVARMGSDIGRISLMKMMMSLAPSIFADSSISGEMPLKKESMMNALNTLNRFGRINTRKLP